MPEIKQRPSRISTYVHSDSVSEAFGAAMLRISADTDFCLRDQEIKDFCTYAAMLVYGAGSVQWSVIDKEFPELLQKLEQLRKKTKENIQIEEIILLTPDRGFICTDMIQSWPRLTKPRDDDGTH